MEQLYQLQVQLTGMDTLWEAGLTGKGVRIAVFDAGFRGLEDHPAFADMWENGRMIEARDFYRGKRPLAHSLHGTAVLGCIVGTWGDRRIGAAADAEILLARTEYGPAERLREQDAWMAAVEWADQKGADIISSSLGYANPLHTYAEMDGHTTTIAKAAATAVRKGILVVNSAGNQGDGKFHFISSPGDADSVLTVGASYPMIRFPMPFSSFGPNAAGVTKPDVAGPGYLLTAGKKGQMGFFSGTSFACPTVAGIAACLMQKYPDLTNMEIRSLLVESGHFFPYYDYVMGYGVVNARHLLGATRDTVAPTFSLSYLADTLIVTFDSMVLGPDSAFSVNGKPFFFHVADETGRLLEYRYLRVVKGVKMLRIPKDRLPAGTLRIWFEGYLFESKEEE
jgi:subtilisin family serine protease